MESVFVFPEIPVNIILECGGRDGEEELDAGEFCPSFGVGSESREVLSEGRYGGRNVSYTH
jgi:hypothetical protein